MCASGWHCFLTHIDYGMRMGGGAGDIMKTINYEQEYYSGRFVFSMLFFLVIIVILLNIVFGIIIDTFAELREETTKNENDKKDVCFICGKHRDEIEKAGINFNHHKARNHNLWNYIYYIIGLKFQDPQDLNAVDSFALERIEKSSISWLPELVIEENVDEIEVNNSENEVSKKNKDDDMWTEIKED